MRKTGGMWKRQPHPRIMNKILTHSTEKTDEGHRPSADSEMGTPKVVDSRWGKQKEGCFINTIGSRPKTWGSGWSVSRQ